MKRFAKILTTLWLALLVLMFSCYPCNADEAFIRRAVRTILSTPNKPGIELKNCSVSSVNDIFEQEVALASCIQDYTPLVLDARDDVYIYEIQATSLVFFTKKRHISIKEGDGYAVAIWQGQLDDETIARYANIAKMNETEYKAHVKKQEQRRDAFFRLLLDEDTN